MKQILILGGGMGGLISANRLRKKLSKEHRITLIDKNDKHIYAPSFLWVMMGNRKSEKIQKSLNLLGKKGINFINEEILGIEPEKNIVTTEKNKFNYDYLIISLGADLAPEKINGLSKAGYNLYQLKDVEKLRGDLEYFHEGKIAIVISSLPFKCPAAPYEAAFILDDYFSKKKIRNKIEISIFTPEILPMPSAGRENGIIIESMLKSRNINFNPEKQVISINPKNKEIIFKEDRIVDYDLLVFVPPHQGPKVIRDSGIGNESGWIPVNKNTLKTKYDNVFAIGDVTSIILDSGKPLPKAGVFAHFEAEVVAENIAREIKGLIADRKYDGKAYCFLEVGRGKSGFASGNFYAKPAPLIKMRRLGRIWHLGKILFEKYWLWKFP